MRSFFIAWNIHAMAPEETQPMTKELQTIKAQLQSKLKDLSRPP